MLVATIMLLVLVLGQLLYLISSTDGPLGDWAWNSLEWCFNLRWGIGWIPAVIIMLVHISLAFGGIILIGVSAIDAFIEPEFIETIFPQRDSSCDCK